MDKVYNPKMYRPIQSCWHYIAVLACKRLRINVSAAVEMALIIAKYLNDEDIWLYKSDGKRNANPTVAMRM